MKSVPICKKEFGSILLVIFLSANSSLAATLHVPGDQPTIAAAVSAAAPGDVIIIAPGTYVERSKILIDKQLTISSQWHATGDTQFVKQTVLDGVDRNHTLFETVDNLGVDVEISGLTFTRFRKPIILNDAAVIQHNVFTNNSSDCISFEARGFGYAGFNTIEGCGDDGIDVDAGEGTFTIEFNTIRNNLDDGIEIRLFSGAQPNITYDIHDNILSGNDEDGIQLIDHASDDSGRVFDIYNNVIDNNTMAGLGCMSNGNTIENFGGADIVERVNFYNNTVINNTVGVTGADNFIALNNIIANNTHEGVKRLRVDSVIAHSIFDNNGTHISDAVTDVGIILDRDPEYDPVTHELLPGSPSIDRGVAVFVWKGALVLGWDPSEYVGPAPDMGAKEFGSEGSAGNIAPTVSAGIDQVILGPTDSTVLEGQVSDDGLPFPPGAVTTIWNQENGPGSATFSAAFVDASDPTTTVSFSQQGKYQLRLTGDDGELTASDSVVVRYANGGNGATVPVLSSGETYFEAEDYAYLYGTAQEVGDVDASGGVAIEAPNGLGTEAFTEHTLVVTDQNVTFYIWIRGKGYDQNSDSVFVSFMDGAEIEVSLSSDDTYDWFQVSGNFITPAGAWPLNVRAGEDGVIWDRLVFTTDPGFVPDINLPPMVNAGLDQQVILPNDATLDGTVIDDGLPNPPGTVTARWTQVSGPGNVTFGDAGAVDTTASFSDPGTYVLRLIADDNQLTTFDELTVTVKPQVTQNTLEVRVSASTDDAEERISTGSVKLTSSDLELVNEGSTSRNQIVGMRFNGITLPPGATITKASIQFQVDELDSVVTSLTLQGQDADNAATFTSANGNISTRPRTLASVAWSLVPWTTVGTAGPDQQTPDIAAVIQEIIDRPGWSSGNSLVILITGSGERTAESFNGVSAVAPLLHVEYTTVGGVNRPPAVDAGADQTLTLSNAATLDGTATDDGLPNPPGVVNATWSQVSGPGNVTFGDPNREHTTATFSEAGTYVLALEGDDGALQTTDQVMITVDPAGGGTDTLDIRVSASTDDAEERIATGSVKLTSSDLELVNEGSASKNQIVGMRFNGITLPPGATITNASIQFQVDELDSVFTSLTLQGQDTDNAATFTSANGNISTRPQTLASIPWNPVPWTTVGTAGPDQQTPDIAAVIQEIIDRPGWSSGNSLVILISGSGERTAESFNGVSAAAPLLHVEYQ